METVLVTGASSGVGRAIATHLARADYRVLAMGRNVDALESLAQEPNIEAVVAELTDREAVWRCLEGKDIDLLINNAGVMPMLGPFQEADQEEIDSAIAINFSAQVALTRRVVGGMCRRGRGHVFFTSSIAAHSAVANMAVYCATKSALSGFAQALRLDVAGDGVRVTEIVAGRIETNLYRDILSKDRRAAMYANDAAVQPEHVADMISAVLALPPSVDVSRFDIIPTRQGVPAGLNNRSQ